MTSDPLSHIPSPTPAGPGGPVGIWTVVLLYAAFAGLWILLSDAAVEWIWSDPAKIVLASTLKGWAFVVATSLLLYGLMRRLLRPGIPDASPPAARRALLLPLILLTLAILGLTGGGIAHTVINRKNREVAQLRAIAELKTRQVADWVAERQGDARFVQSSHFWADLYGRWRDTRDAASFDLLQHRMDEFRQYNAFQGIRLLDEKGALLWDSEPGPFEPDPALEAAMRRSAAAAPHVTHIGPYRDAAGRLHLDFLAPLPPAENRLRPIVVLHVDPGDHLFRMLQTWPAPSASGETLLFRREGDQIVYLNELRHRKDTAGNLRVPLAAENLLAAQILRAQARPGTLVNGVDYRGVPVLGVVRAVPGTDWFLVAKMDQAELYAAVTKDAIWIGLAGLLALFMAGTGALLFRQRQALGAAQREHELQAERLRAMELLDAIAEGSSDAIFAKDREGRYLLFNREAARISGKPPQEVLGRDDCALFPPAQAASIMAHDRQVVAENRSVTFQEDLSTADGEISFLATKGPLHDPEGKVIGMFGISRDITERKRSEAALRASEERLRLFIEHAPVALAMLDADLRYLSCSRRWLTDYDLVDQAVIGRSHYEVFPEIPDHWKAVHRRALAGEVVRAENDRFERADGSVQWQRWEVRPWRDQAGDIAGLVIFSEDITARRETEAALARSEERFRQAMDAASDGLWDWDVPSGVIYFSPGYFRMLGYEPGAIPGDTDTLLALVHPEDRERVLEAHGDCIRNAAPSVDVEFRMRSRDGHWHWILGRGKALRRDAEGQALQMVGTYTDITARKQAEEQRSHVEAQLRQAQKMEALGTLAGGIAHDFNNILGIIIGFTELAMGNAGGPEAARADLGEVLLAAHRARDLVQQILAFSRLGEPEKKPVQVGLIVKEALKMLRASLPATIEIKTHVKSRTVVLADPTQIHQVLMNLCANAGHAMQATGGVLDVRLEDARLGPLEIPPHSDLHPGAFVRLTVKDTGHGIPPELLGRIFDPFFTTKEPGVGTGLGLAVVHGIVTNHGGAIKVSSTPGRGTAFEVLLPAMDRAQEPAMQDDTPLPRGHERILVVDDEPALTQITRQMLERLGYQVECRASGIDALKAFGNDVDGKPFDLVITDMTMPKLTGADLARELLNRHPDLPIILSTGFSDKLDAEAARRLGLKGILPKPFVVRELARMVREALDGTLGLPLDSQ
jgi:PAS domain S-box-containing protein